jgi:membrane protein implicated in regulation of membrane protease activity
MRIASILSLGLFGVWVALAILDMWFDIVGWDLFLKITITFILVVVLVVCIALVKREYMEDKQMKKDKYID